MANKEFEKMIKLGEWLEKCLSPNIDHKKVNRIFNKGLKLCGVSHQKISPLKKIENLKIPSTETIYEYLESLKQAYSKLKVKKTDVPFHKMSSTEINELLKSVIKFEKANPESIHLPDVYDFFVDIYSLKNLFKELKSVNLTWQQAIPILAENDSFYSIIKCMLRDFPSISETLLETNGQIILTKAIDSSIYPNNETIWCYQIVLSNIFFEFLFLGGQNYFLFCKYCDRFTVVRRKGRKKFCSDLCRTNHRNEKLAMQ